MHLTKFRNGECNTGPYARAIHIRFCYHVLQVTNTYNQVSVSSTCVCGISTYAANAAVGTFNVLELNFKIDKP